MPKQKSKSKVKYTSEQIDRSLGNERLRLSIFLVLAAGGCMIIFVLALDPLAKTIAGTSTNFNVTVSLAFNITLAVTTVCGGGGCFELNRRRQHHSQRAKHLEGRLRAMEAK